MTGYPSTPTGKSTFMGGKTEVMTETNIHVKAIT